MSIQAFELAIDRFIDVEVPEEVGKLARLIGVIALQKVVLKSPVDRGRFRSGWMVTIDTRTDEAPPEPAIKSGRRGRSTRGAAAASNVLSVGVGVINGAKPFQNIILQNNVEYAEEIEDGSSKGQAPQGVLAISVAEIEAIF